jgi:prepilin-type N-terminal cleavage/methylation domain-containing protein/prepilin-type processing-associated H-X9-DG protein
MNAGSSQTINGMRLRRRAFTLIELLVVIGIIAVLTALLLPTLASARRQANSARCLAHLRQIGNAFHLYSADYEGDWPVTLQDLPDDASTGHRPAVYPVQSLYWTDFLLPYLIKSKGGTPTYAQQIAEARQAFAGCPEWTAPPPEAPGTTSVSPVGYPESQHDVGYGMNYYPSARHDYPSDPYRFPNGLETSVRSQHFYFQGAIAMGKYYKMTQWTKPAERLLVVDSTIWLLAMSPTNAAGDIAPQPATRALARGPGANQIDRYRHGRYPQVKDGNFDPAGGRVAFNALFCDGSARTMYDVREGYKAIRMRYP